MSSLIDLSGGAPEVAALDFNMAKNMAECLHRTYPGHLWAVTCEGEKGIATIRNLGLSGEWGYILKLNLISSVSAWEKELLMAAGELLERFNLHRGLANRDAIASVQNDFSGRSIGDYAK